MYAHLLQKAAAPLARSAAAEQEEVDADEVGVLVGELISFDPMLERCLVSKLLKG